MGCLQQKPTLSDATGLCVPQATVPTLRGTKSR